MIGDGMVYGLDDVGYPHEYTFSWIFCAQVVNKDRQVNILARINDVGKLVL